MQFPAKLKFALVVLAASLLQACATTAPIAERGPIRALPPMQIELTTPELALATRANSAPSVVGLLTRSTQALGNVLMNALSFTGTRYRYGGSSPVTGFDCSGFVSYVYRESAGLKLPRASYQMANTDGPKLRQSELQPGDLVFFAQRKRVDHVGIYLGNGRFIHSPSRGGRVRTDNLTDNYWRRHFVSGKRVLVAAADAPDGTRVAGTVAGSAGNGPSSAAATSAPAGSSAGASQLFEQVGSGAR